MLGGVWVVAFALELSFDVRLADCDLLGYKVAVAVPFDAEFSVGCVALSHSSAGLGGVNSHGNVTVTVPPELP